MYELALAVSLRYTRSQRAVVTHGVVLLHPFPLQTLTLAWTAAPLSLIFKTPERRVLPLY